MNDVTLKGSLIMMSLPLFYLKEICVKDKSAKISEIFEVTAQESSFLFQVNN